MKQANVVRIDNPRTGFWTPAEDAIITQDLTIREMVFLTRRSYWGIIARRRYLRALD